MIPQVFPQMGLGYATRWSYFLQDVWDWHEILFSNRTCFYESGVALLESVVMIWVCLCLSENRIGMKPKSNGWSWGLYLIFRYTHFIISMVMTQEPRKIGCTDSIYFWHMFQAYASGNIPTIHMVRNMVRLRTSNHFRILEISHWYYSFLSIWLNLSFWACWLPDVASPFPEPSGASHENVESKSCQGKHGRHGPGNHQGKWVPVVFGMMNQQEHACCFLSVSGRVFQRRWKNDVQKGECVSSVCSPLVSTIIRISK